MNRWLVLFLCAAFHLKCDAAAHLGPPTTYSEMCDASGGAFLNDDLFVVADDESNVLRIYSRTKGGRPVSEIDLDRFMEVGKKNSEGDLEAAARVGDVIYWISSHGRNRHGKARASRDRFFATKIVTRNGQPTLEPSGEAYKLLLEDLRMAPQLQQFDLAEASSRAPKENGALNIEGLCAGPGKSLLIGFRNPVPHGKALVVPLLNPEEVVQGRARAKLGEPLRVDLGGDGIRDMLQAHDAIYILAGSSGVGGRTKLFRWDGKSETAESLGTLHPHGGNPEALLELPESKSKFYMLTDEGTRQEKSVGCKDLPASRRTFRGFVLKAKE